MTLPFLKMKPETSGPGARWRWKVTFTSVIEDLRQEAKKRTENQQNRWDILKLCGSHERASDCIADKLEGDALSKEVNHGEPQFLRTGAKMQVEGQNVTCKEGKASTVNGRQQNGGSQRTQAPGDWLLATEPLDVRDMLGIVAADAQLKQIEKVLINGVEERETKPRQFVESAQIADILHTTGRACNFLSCQVQEREKILGKSNGVWLVAVPEVVSQGNLLNMYDIEFFEGDRGCVTLLRPVQGIDIHVKLCERENWTADDFLLKRGLLEDIGHRQDTKVSTTSGATTPTRSVRGTPSYARNRSISRVDTLWDGAECDDGNGNATWGPEFFLLERESTANDQYQSLTGKVTCAEGDMQCGWAQAAEFTESLLRVDDEGEERGNGRGIHQADERCAVVSDTDQLDSVCGQVGREKDMHFLTSNQETFPPRSHEHYASFLTDTNLIETILRECAVF